MENFNLGVTTDELRHVVETEHITDAQRVVLNGVRYDRLAKSAVFRDINLLADFPCDLLEQATHVLIQSPLEWFIVTREWADKGEQRYVVGLYKSILQEMLDRDWLAGMPGADDEYVMTCLALWAKAPPPPFPKTSLAEYLRYQSALQRGGPLPPWHQNRQHPWHPLHITTGDDEKESSSRCEYCKLGCPCMAGSDGESCTDSGAKVQRRCRPEAGLHLCNLHGCKLLLARRGCSPMEFPDGRTVPHMGILSIKAKAQHPGSSAHAKKAERHDELLGNEGLGREVMYLPRKKQPAYLRADAVMGFVGLDGQETTF